MDGMWSDPERVVAFLESIISFASILVNIFQWITNRSMKKTLKGILSGAKSTFGSILSQTEKMKNSTPSEQDSIIASIEAHAERGEDQIERTFDTILK
jgi:hypothetical protein